MLLSTRSAAESSEEFDAVFKLRPEGGAQRRSEAAREAKRSGVERNLK